MNYVPHSAGDRQKMLAAIGKQQISELFDRIPAGARLTRALDLPEQLSEYEVHLHLEELASKNLVPSRLSFLRAGAYRHFVPAVVDTIQPSEFITAYTPYQPDRFAHATPVSHLDEVRAARKPVLRWEEGLS